MAAYTEHYNAKKPAKSENYDVEVANFNNDLWDEKIFGKQDKTPGKGLSTNDFTNAYKSKLDSLENYNDAALQAKVDNNSKKISTAEKNIQNLQTDNETNKQNIQDLQSEQETQNTAIENNTEELELLKNNLPDPITTDQSEEITVKDAMNYYSQLDISGNSTQDTRSGKNRLKLSDVAETTNGNGITYSVKDGVITLNGTSTRPHYINFKSDAIDLPANNYTMSTKVLSGSYSGTAGKQLNEVKEDGTETNIFNGNYIENTTTREITEDKSSVFFALYIGGTDVFNNYKFEVQLEEGTQATEIEKYGAMPSPEFPSEIKNCKTSINIKVENANKYVPFEASWGAFRGIELDFYLDGTVKLNGTAAASGGRDVTKNVSTKNLLKAGKSYTMYSEIVSGTGQTGHVYLNRVSDNSGLRFCQDGSVRNFTQNADVEVYWGINVNEGNVFDNLVLRLGLFEGTYTYEEIKAKFVTHAEQTKTFPLEEGQKMYEGSYLADDRIHHVRKQRIINLSDFYVTMPFSGLLSVANNNNPVWDYKSIEGLCSHFKNAENETITTNNQANANLQDNEFNFRMGDTKDRIYFKNSAFTTLEDWQNFFNENEVLVEYECTEYTEAYTEEQQAVYNELQRLLLYKGYNYITCIDETKCKLKLTYRPDNNSKIKSLEERVSALENSEVTA